MATEPASEGVDDDPYRHRNELSRAIDHSPSVGTALGGFGAYMFGALLLMIGVFVALGGLLLVTATTGTGGWEDRSIGCGLIVISLVLFLVGRWATGQYTVQRR